MQLVRTDSVVVAVIIIQKFVSKISYVLLYCHIIIIELHIFLCFFLFLKNSVFVLFTHDSYMKMKG